MNYKSITISGKVGVGTSTLAKNIHKTLGWKYVNAGAIQREYDRKNNRKENQQGALTRSDAHEREIDEMTRKMLTEEANIIYEGWLAGYVARGIEGVFKVLVVCSNDGVRIDRIVNRDNVTVDEAKQWLKQREEENIIKWKKIYGNQDFWGAKHYDMVIDTYGSGPMQTAGLVLDKLGYKG